MPRFWGWGDGKSWGIGGVLLLREIIDKVILNERYSVNNTITQLTLTYTSNHVSSSPPHQRPKPQSPRHTRASHLRLNHALRRRILRLSPSRIPLLHLSILPSQQRRRHSRPHP